MCVGLAIPLSVSANTLFIGATQVGRYALRVTVTLLADGSELSCNYPVGRQRYSSRSNKKF